MDRSAPRSSGAWCADPSPMEDASQSATARALLPASLLPSIPLSIPSSLLSLLILPFQSPLTAASVLASSESDHRKGIRNHYTLSAVLELAVRRESWCFFTAPPTHPMVSFTYQFAFSLVSWRNSQSLLAILLVL